MTNTFSADKKTLLFIHGAKDKDPLKTMGGIKNLTQEQYNIFIYQYDYQEPFEKLVKGLIEQWQFTCNKHGIENKNIVVLAFSYGTVIFRAAALDKTNQNLFKSIYMIQLAPIGGGAADVEKWTHPYFNVSLLDIVQNKMHVKINDINVGLALNPYGPLQRELYSDAANERFFQSLRGSFSIIAKNDRVTLHNSSDTKIRDMYLNGLGNHYAIVPANHRELPNETNALYKMAELLGIHDYDQKYTSLEP